MFNQPIWLQRLFETRQILSMPLIMAPRFSVYGIARKGPVNEYVLITGFKKFHKRFMGAPEMGPN
jgi:hypothetical protein